MTIKEWFLTSPKYLKALLIIDILGAVAVITSLPNYSDILVISGSTTMGICTLIMLVLAKIKQ